MGNGSTKPGDALADKIRDDLIELRHEREDALHELASADWRDTHRPPSRIEMVSMADQSPIPPWHRLPLWFRILVAVVVAAASGAGGWEALRHVLGAEQPTAPAPSLPAQQQQAPKP